MKLTQESVKRLKLLLQTASLAKIDKLIIEDGIVRGVDDNQTVVIISNIDVPDFGGAKVGLIKLQTLANRISLFDSNTDLVVETIEAPTRNNESDVNVSSLKLSSKGSKFEFKLGRVDLIKAPKRINDIMAWSIIIPSDLIKTVITAANTMDADQIAVVCKTTGEVSFEIIDSSNGTNDTFITKITDNIDWILDEDDKPIQSFVHYYSMTALLPLLKVAATHGDPAILIGEEGMLQITVNNYTLTLLPREN
jgi:hypothetical protein